MPEITADIPRRIIDDFAKEILQSRDEGPNPTEAVIFFRQDRKNNKARKIWLVPVNKLRFRKDNGRIASEVESYEKLKAPLLENIAEDQTIIKGFLDGKDTEKTDELMNSLRHSGQLEPAIITSDGFLINGNRRKLALEKLYEETHDEDYKWMRVVILPGKNDNDQGGPPTPLEIEQIENRYEFQTLGKAEYFNFDRAIAMRRKINDVGMDLESQLMDNPEYAHLNEREFKKAVEKFKKDFLDPLESVDDYLEATGNAGLYTIIAQGVSDREGRWQAFLDYSNSVQRKLSNEKERIKLGISEDEVGKVKDVAFKVIRQRDFKDISKLYSIMRKFPKLIADQEAKKALFELTSIPMDPQATGDPREKDREWQHKNSEKVIRQVKKSLQALDWSKTKAEPIQILEAVINDLNRNSLDPRTLTLTDLPVAMKLADKIKELADGLSSDYYHMKKDYGSEAVLEKFAEKYRVTS